MLIKAINGYYDFVTKRTEYVTIGRRDWELNETGAFICWKQKGGKVKPRGW